MSNTSKSSETMSASWTRALPKARYYDSRKIKSNISLDDLQLNLNILQHFVNEGHVFANFVGQRFDITDMNVYDREVGEAKTKEAVVVVEITVDKDMSNPYGTLHGACAAYLVDLCTSMPLIALGIAIGIDGSGMSQAMDIVYHSAAPVGARLRVVATTLTIAGRIMAARCEIRNKKSGALLVSATHTKVNPYAKKASEKSKL
ncbi:hypothetical protein GLOTRDRAFT_125213 [Gloeophyllum trabeum ATCC 11539]|uniref:Thioesterase domain-containing protein n=1 Tax=Gloeophyllum trabeum (strain ATCC 11539 / FP-39264 / Madison 617) TaxID=670483 RepID=S7RVQ2_GLOTA|nr:uncharacterized protein GLOTRDRAFT_125213 [Gloeophyllum trabeum ATCC 11539]EPQ58890.1 hypothetical protein GLOTRDRAFT_125213 [Gloeophyllum trabeum ATCC 11539]